MTEEKLTFEQALEKLESCADKIGNADIPLEEAIRAYEEGTVYYKRCEEILDSANQRIEEIGEDHD
ncbi:MAG: exodeoxyribonuclease VII small subunit [Clostridiales Family XIII bacterium]|nr:exodeoxyribonuclease VII small subunit [Clostridiales Family XIII bacterium]